MAASDASFGSAYPILCDFLTLTGVGGKGREVGKLTIFCEDGKWKGNLQDVDQGEYAFLSADSFQGLLEGLEKGLARGSLDWRVSKWGKKR